MLELCQLREYARGNDRRVGVLYDQRIQSREEGEAFELSDKVLEREKCVSETEF